MLDSKTDFHINDHERRRSQRMPKAPDLSRRSGCKQGLGGKNGLGFSRRRVVQPESHGAPDKRERVLGKKQQRVYTRIRTSHKVIIDAGQQRYHR